MEKRFKKMLVGLLVMSMLLGGVLSAQAGTKDAGTETEKPKVVVTQCIMASPPMSEIQYQKFIAYLTKEYAPELQAEWDKAFAARKAIELPVESNLSANVEVRMSKVLNGPVEMGIDKLNKAQEDSNIEATVATVTTDAAEPGGILSLTLPEDANKTLEPGSVVSIAIPKLNGKTFDEQLKLQDQLDKAITSNDGKAIQAVLGKMLTNYNEVSEDMKTSLSKVEVVENSKNDK